MKKSCPRCHTIIEINEKELYPGTEVVRRCPLCNEPITYAVPKLSTDVESALNMMSEALRDLQKQLTDIRASVEAERLAFATALKAAEERARQAASDEKADTQSGDTADNSLPDTLQRLSIAANGVVFDMVYVEGGMFDMGCTPEQQGEEWSDETPVRQVSLSGYYIGETEVTQGLWRAVMGAPLEQHAEQGPSIDALHGEGNDFPMYNVSFYDAMKFIEALNSLTGLTFRLPTEAEWEYAARGGNKSRGKKYPGGDSAGLVAWYADNSGRYTHPVKKLRPNELYLYDMSGNVREWCSDWYGSYHNASQKNPTGPVTGYSRVCRGGGWYQFARSCRVSARASSHPASRYTYQGFRLALSK